MSSDRTLEVNLGVDEHDELDRKIDRALGRVGMLVRTLFIIGVLAFLGLFVVYPQWDSVGPFITTGVLHAGSPTVGQIGTGVARAPIAVFDAALVALAHAWNLPTDLPPPGGVHIEPVPGAAR